MNSNCRRRTPAPLIVTLLACSTAVAAAAAAGEKGAKGAATVDGARIVAADSEPQNWLAHGRTYGEQRYSPLAQVNDGNVEKLGLAWSYATGTTRGLQASPIVVDGTMYTTGTWSVVWALDAKTGRELWKFDPEVPRAWGRYLCCDAVNRGVAVWKGAVYVGTIDGRLVSLDAKSGAKRWEVNTIDRSKPYSITGAPRVVKGKVSSATAAATSACAATSPPTTPRRALRPGASTSRPAIRRTASSTPSSSMAAEELERRVVAHRRGGGGGTAWDAFAYDPEADRSTSARATAAPGTATPAARGRRQPLPRVDSRAQARHRTHGGTTR
jgi:quinohemoprotein ethanol dehydrogenase